MDNLTAESFEIRQDILDIIYRSKAGHIGGDFSVCDILTALYYGQMNVSPENIHDPNRDRFVLSKGHSVEALYAVLASRGFFPKEDLKTVSQYNSKYIGHPNNKVNGIEMNSGSLGHGLSVCVGMALAGKMNNAPYRVYTVMGDGELAEGSVWEGAMAAGHYHLDNLTAFVDRNRLQISGSTEEVMTGDDMEQRFASFGWHVIKCEGNNFAAVDAAIAEAKRVKNKPTMIILETLKGNGISFMENVAGWHHGVPTKEQYEQGMAELTAKEAEINE